MGSPLIQWPNFTFGHYAGALTGISVVDAGSEYLAYVFMMPASGALTDVEVRCSAASGSPVASAQFQTIDAGGVPSGTAYGGSEAEQASLTANTNATFSFSPAVTCVQGDVVCLKMGLVSGTSFNLSLVNASAGQSALPLIRYNAGSDAKLLYPPMVQVKIGGVWYLPPGCVPVGAMSGGVKYNYGPSPFTGLVRGLAMIHDWTGTGLAGRGVLHDGAGTLLAQTAEFTKAQLDNGTTSREYELMFPTDVPVKAGAKYYWGFTPTSGTATIEAIALSSVETRADIFPGIFGTTSFDPTEGALIGRASLLFSSVEAGSAAGAGHYPFKWK